MQTVNHSFPRAFRYSIVAAILCSSLSVLWVLFKSYLPIFEQTGDALILPLGAFLSPIIALSGRVPQNRPSGSSRLRFAQRWVPVVYVIITISECIGTVLPIYRSVVLNDSSSPLFWSVGFDMTAYLFCIISFVLQPMDPVPGPEQLRRFLDSMRDLTPGVRHHHECWDGSGYPDQLAGERIPLVARIIAVAEFYDTLLRTYCYQAKVPSEEARVEMQGRAGTQFDPAIVRNLLVVLDRQLETQQLIQAIGSG